MPKRPDVWLRYKTVNGKRRPDSFYFRKLRLKTQDAGEARNRVRLHKAGKWPPQEEAAAAVTAEAFTFDPPPPAAPPSPAASSPPPADPPPAAPAEPVQGDWTTAAAAASSEAREESAPPPPPPQQVSSEQLANLVIDLQLKGTEIYVQQKYFEAFVAPAIAPQGRAILCDAYRTMFDYAGAAVALPPWVNGLVVPGLTVVICSMAMVAGFREIALEQKARAQKSEGGA